MPVTAERLRRTVGEGHRLVVKVGSRMIDTSLRTRLMTVKNQLKEVG